VPRRCLKRPSSHKTAVTISHSTSAFIHFPLRLSVDGLAGIERRKKTPIEVKDVQGAFVEARGAEYAFFGEMPLVNAHSNFLVIYDRVL
jgi:hypothetical protein